MATHPTRYIAIMGATATGKSALAIDLARRFSGEVVSMDSRQVYRHMDIGTGKVSRDERGSVPHHLIDTVEPDESWNTGRHVSACRRIMRDIAAAGHVSFLVGGTGLYFRALFEGLLDVHVDEDALARTRRGFEGQSTAALHARLTTADPDRADEISLSDRVRIVRALELIIHTGTPASALYARQKRGGAGEGLRMVLSMPRPALRARIAERTRALFAAGWPSEVRRLLERGITLDAQGMKSLGYAEIAGALQSGDDPASVLDTVITRTQQYAKRQETFFRSVAAARWIDVSQPGFADTAAEMVASFLGSRIE